MAGVVEKSIQERVKYTHTSLSVFEDSGPSGVTKSKTVPAVFTADCRSGHASQQAAHRSLLVRTLGLLGFP